MFKYLIALLRVGPRIIYSYFAFMRRYARHPERTPLEERWRRYRELVLAVFRALNVEVHTEGLGYLQRKESQFIVSNHLSYFDPLVLVALSSKPLIFVSKKETLKFPFIGKAILGLDGLFLDRQNLKQEVKVMMQVREVLMAKKYTVVLYPEGTRNRSFNLPLGTFKTGSFKFPAQVGTPIIPLAMVGQQFVLKAQIPWRKYPIFVKISPANPALNHESVTTKVSDYYQSEIERMLLIVRQRFDLRISEIVQRKKDLRFIEE